MLDIVKSSMKRSPKAYHLGEVVEVGRVDHFDLDKALYDGLDEVCKKDPAQLEAVGTGQRLWPKTTSKTS